MVTGVWWNARVAHSQASSAAVPAGQHTAMSPGEMKWGEAPPVFHKGLKMAVLYGEPGTEGSLYVVQLRAPAGYKIMPHWHPRDENITVISGSFAAGMGDKFDQTVKALPPGSFASMPAGMHHFAYFPTESTIQVTGIGPFKLTYVHPEDDPSKQRATR
jgi:quercetin dioxygenase-like cupin family protein